MIIDKLTGVTKFIEGKPYVKIIDSSSDYKNKTFKVIESPVVIMEEGREVIGYLVLINKSNKKYGFAVVKSKNDILDVDILAMLAIIDINTINRMNNEKDLFTKGKKYVTIEDIYSNSRKTEVVMSRHISQYVTYQIVGNRLSEDQLEDLHKKDRCSVRHAVKNIKNLYNTEKQIKKIVDDVMEATKIVYNNLKNI